MNDPHVEALIYRVEHRVNVNYERATPLEHDGEHFDVRIKDCRARFEMKDHCATAAEARRVVEPLIRAWEVDAGLRDGHREIEFVFERAEILDRKPTPGVVHAAAGHMTLKGYPATIQVGRNKYPEPPADLAVNADVNVMYRRYGLYREGEDLLSNMAYFCLTVLEGSAKGGQRTAAAKKYGIGKKVLSTLGRLASEKGGQEARKSKGVGNELTDAERKWMEAAVKVFIRRAAEVAHDPRAQPSQITMADLPPLT